MKRNDFIKKTFISDAFSHVDSSVLKTSSITINQSTYKKVIKEIGYNHIPYMEEKNINTVLHKAITRGHENHGWLEVNRTFSFAYYHNPSE